MGRLMRLLLLSMTPGYEPASYAQFGGDTSILDFDVVVWDPSEVLDEYLSGYGREQYLGLPSLSQDSSARIQRDIERRGREFTEFLKMGRTVLVIVRGANDFYFDTGARTYSGTGRNQKTTVHVDLSNPLKALPVDVSIMAASGTRMDFLGKDGGFTSFWRSQRAFLEYEGFLEGDCGQPLWTIGGTQRVTGSHLRTADGGNLVFLPSPSFPGLESTGKKKSEAQDQAFSFQEALVELACALQCTDSIEDAPASSNDYFLPGEQEKALEVEELDASCCKGSIERRSGRRPTQADSATQGFLLGDWLVARASSARRAVDARRGNSPA